MQAHDSVAVQEMAEESVAQYLGETVKLVRLEKARDTPLVSWTEWHQAIWKENSIYSCFYIFFFIFMSENLSLFCCFSKTDDETCIVPAAIRVRQCVTTWTAWWSAGWWKAEQQRVAAYSGKETRSWRLMGSPSGGNILTKSMTYWYVDTMCFIWFVGMFWSALTQHFQQKDDTVLIFSTHSLTAFIDLPCSTIVFLL